MLIVELGRLNLEPEWGANDSSISLRGATAASANNGARDSIVIYFELPVGKRTGWHTDSAEEVIYIVSGTAEARVGEDQGVVSPGSMVVVPRGLPHDIVNIGDTTVKAIGYFCNSTVHSVFEEALMPRGTATFSLP